jgi:iron(III) transport system permease protein
MISRLMAWIGLGATVTIVVAVIVYPALALVWRAPPVTGAESPLDFPLSLWLRSAGLAAGGAAGAILLGLVGAVVVAGLGGKRGDGWRAGVIVAPLLFPPMIYAFGWNRLLPLPGEWACVAVWATWAWPVAALLLGSAWRATGRDRWEAALLVTSRWRAIVDVVFPMLWRPALVCFCVLFAFFLGDYAVPHACGLIVGATELLLAAESAAHPGAVLGAALPAAGAILAALVLAAFTWRRAEALDESADRGASESPVGVSVGVTLLTLVAVAGPWWGLLRGIDLVSALAETLQTYEREIALSVGIALLGGGLAVWVGALLATHPLLRKLGLMLAIPWAALPGGLIGAALITAYIPIPLVYDHWPIMVLGYVARFGWIGIATGWLAQMGVGRAQREAARSDGATETGVALRIGLAGQWPTLACGVFVITALSLSEVATTALVRVPAVNPIALILIEKFHRFEDGILVGICLVLTAVSLPGALLAGAVGRRLA